MIYVEEHIKDYFGKIRYKNQYTGDDFIKADEVFKSLNTKNKVEMFGNEGELIAIKKEQI